jgi:hypothetical protein
VAGPEALHGLLSLRYPFVKRCQKFAPLLSIGDIHFAEDGIRMKGFETFGVLVWLRTFPVNGIQGKLPFIL